MIEPRRDSPGSVSLFPLANWWRTRRAQRRRIAELSAGFDLRWARWLVTLSAPLTAANFMHFDPMLDWIAAIGTGVFAVLLCGYFAWLLFGRLQCSLLELLVLVAFLGHVEGLVLTTPRLTGLAAGAWALAPLMAGWVLYGTVAMLVQAKLLGLEKPVHRLLLLFGNWLILATPALLVAGVLLDFGAHSEGMISRDMAAWSVPLLVSGAVGCVVYVLLSVKTRRAARRILSIGK